MRLWGTWVLLLVFLISSPSSGQIGFRRTTFPTGAQPVGVISGDFNGDSKADLVTVNSNGNSVSMLLGNGDGTFQAKTDFTVGSSPRVVVAADFNGDNKLDLVTANFNSNTISLLMGTGSGGFAPRVDFAAGTGPRSLVTGDFNADAKLDLAVANGGSGSISILLGNGTGGFQTPGPPAVTTAPFPVFVTAADLHGDAKLDLIVVVASTTSVATFRGNGDGTFGPAITIAGPVAQTSLVAKEISGDGFVDLTVLDASQIALNVLLGNGTGSFAQGSILGTDTEPISLAAADLDNDGKPDLAAGTAGYYYYYFYGPYLPRLSVFRGSGGGAFAPRLDFDLAWSGALGDMVSADFNGDARPDLAVIELGLNQVSVLLHSSFLRPSPASIQFSPNQPVGTTSPPQTITVASTGSFPAAITGVSISGTHPTNFAKSSDTCTGTTVPVGSSCTFEIAFAPTARGGRNATVQIASNGTSSPDQIGLFGIGAGAGVLTPVTTSLGFGDQSIFTSSPTKPVNLNNTGTEALSPFAFNINGPFTVNHNCPQALSAGASCNANVAFGPTALGTANGSLSIVTDTVASPTTIALSGNGIPAPGVTLSATSLNFGAQPLGSSSANQTITVTAVGTGTLSVGVGLSGGDFVFMNNCASTITGGNTCTIVVSFRPTTVGARTGTLAVTTNAAGSPHTISLAGTGTDLTVSASSTSTSVTAGQAATFQITLTGAGGFSGSVSLTCSVARSSGAPEPTMTCTPSPASVTVTGTTPAQATIRVGTTAPSMIFWRPRVPIPPHYLLLLALAAGLLQIWVARMARIQTAKRRLALAMLTATVVVILAACGSSGPQLPGTPTGNYVATVAATGSGATRTISFNVAVQ